jgi:hypothetical protein
VHPVAGTPPPPAWTHLPPLRARGTSPVPCPRAFSGLSLAGLCWRLHPVAGPRVRKDAPTPRHAGAAVTRHGQGRTHGTARPRVGAVTPTAPHPPAASPAPAERPSAHRGEGGPRLGGGRAVPIRGGQTARPRAPPATRHADAPISAQATGPLRMLGPRASASSRARRASSAWGWGTTRPRERARRASPKPSRLPARGCTPTQGSATAGGIQPLPRVAMGSTQGPVRMRVRANATSSAPPAQALARRSARTSGPAGASTRSTCIGLWRRMTPWSRRNASRLRGSNGCVSVTSQGTLAIHEPYSFLLC